MEPQGGGLLFEEGHHNNDKNNKMSTDMGSVPDLSIATCEQ